MASIPKLSAQWKISFDVKPMEDWQGAEPRGLWVQSWSADDHLELNFGISFPHSNIRLCWNNGGTIVDMTSNQLPKLDEWSRIEISHLEEEGGNYFLSFSVGGKEVGRKGFELGRNMTDVKIYHAMAHGLSGRRSQPGFIKGLLVFDKQ